MKPLSVVIITYNEERNIRRCLESIQPVADEIVIVDSFSTDGTKSICSEYNTRFIEQKFLGYIEQKNFALGLAENDYVLSLDADEALNDELLDVVRKAKKAGFQFDGYWMNRCTNYCGTWVRHATWYPDRKLRLFNRKKAAWGGENPHDKIEMEPGSVTGHLKGDILHYSYYSVQQHYLQVEHFTTIAAYNLFKRGKKPPVYKLIVNPLFKFVNYYLIHLGFLDGKAGYLISKISAYAAYVKYKKARQLFKKKEIPNDFTIVLSRTDAIGDVVLTLPMAGFLKEKFPSCRVIFLGRNYTRDIVALSEHVDEFISYDDLLAAGKIEGRQKIENINAGFFIHVFPVAALARLAKKAGVPVRVGTANRIYHWFTCNKLIKLSRKNSILHEAQLNMQLLSFLNIDTSLSLDAIHRYYGFSKIPVLENKWKAIINPDTIQVILHPKSKNSAREWGLENFSALITAMPKDKFSIFISGTPADEEAVASLIKEHPHIISIAGKMPLSQFIAFIHHCDALVAASTGPLHIAAALKKKAIGIFAPMRPIHPGRWRPLGEDAHALVLNKECNDCRKQLECHCIKSIQPLQVLSLLENK